MKKIKNKISVKGKLRITTYKAGTKEILRQTDWMPNLVVLNNNHGINLLVKRWIGNTTYDLEITHAEIGHSNTPVQNSNTDLVDPFERGGERLHILVATRQETAVDTALFSFFIADAEIDDGDYKEFGLYCGTQLFARSVFSSTYTKSAGEDTKIEYTLEVNNT